MDKIKPVRKYILRLRQLMDEGTTYSEIAEAISSSHQTVSKYMSQDEVEVTQVNRIVSSILLYYGKSPLDPTYIESVREGEDKEEKKTPLAAAV